MLVKNVQEVVGISGWSVESNDWLLGLGGGLNGSGRGQLSLGCSQEC